MTSHGLDYEKDLNDRTEDDLSKEVGLDNDDDVTNELKYVISSSITLNQEQPPETITVT